MVPRAQVRARHGDLQEPHHRAGDGLGSGETKTGEPENNEFAPGQILLKKSRNASRKTETPNDI